MNLDNGIPIVPFFQNDQDSELLQLQSYLKYVNLHDDVWKVNRHYFKLYKYKNYRQLDKLFKNLF